MIFIHSLGQPLIVRSTAREETPRKFPREHHMFPIIVTSLDSTDSKHGVYSITWSLTKLHAFNHLASVAKPQVFYYLVSDAKNIRYNLLIITLVGV